MAGNCSTFQTCPGDPTEEMEGEVGTPLGAMALPMVLIGTTIGVGVRARAAVGVTVRVLAAPRPGSVKVLDMGLDRDPGPGQDMGMEVGVVVLMVEDMGPEVATVILAAVRVAADTVVVADTTSIVCQPLHETKASTDRKNVC